MLFLVYKIKKNQLKTIIYRLISASLVKMMPIFVVSLRKKMKL